MKTKNYYKVVHETGDGQLVSCCHRGTVDENYVVKYRKKEWTIPAIKNSKLFVFNNRKTARIFTKDQKNWVEQNTKIYKCEIQNPTKLEKIVISFSDINKFWNEHNPYIATKPVLPGTIVCDAIKIIKRIY
jgi:hypothetical protein